MSNHSYPLHHPVPPPHHHLQRSLPSPVTSGSVSPVKQSLIPPFPFTHPLDQDPHSDDEPASGEERSKLEARREKNRVKQRNLRMRRANHINELESTNTALRGEIATMRNSVTALQQRENNLHAWIRDLESVLFARSLSNEVNQLRRIWASSSTPTAARGADPLATLANAAAASQRPPPPQTSTRDSYPTPDSAASWEHSPVCDDRKRKREEDVQPPQRPPLRTQRSNDYPAASPRPSSAPHSATQPQAYTLRNVVDDQQGNKESESSRVEASPCSIRISDLLSPLPNDVVGHFHHNEESTTSASPDSTPNHTPQTPPSPMVQLQSTTVVPPLAKASLHNHSLPPKQPHPAVLACHALLLSMFPEPFPTPPLPSSPPPLLDLKPVQYRLSHLTLSIFVPGPDQPLYHSEQIKFLPPTQVDLLIEYQSDAEADTRLVLSPIAILRAKAVSLLQQGFDVTKLFNDTLRHTQIFGATLVTDAWELDEALWSCSFVYQVSGRMASVRRSCKELGLEPTNARRKAPVGKPPGWSL